MFLLSIPKPCHENWNEMSPREQGAFCTVCTKTVVDFTKLSDEEVKSYFIQHSGQKTCGRFRNDQLAEPRTLTELLSRPIPFWKKFLAIVCIVFGSFLSSCNSNNQSKLNNHESSKLESNQKLCTTTGLTIMDIIPDTSFSENRCITMGAPAMITEDTLELPPPILGDVSIQPIQIIKEDGKPDIDIVFVKENIIDSVKQVNSALPKADSVKKIMPLNNCDTITRVIEP